MGIALLTLGFALALPAVAPAEHSVPDLVSTGPGPGGGTFEPLLVYSSPDGRRVLFWTDAALVPEDVDDCNNFELDRFGPCFDYYERFAGSTALVTTGPTDPHGAFDYQVTPAASLDRSRVFFSSPETLVPDDTNGRSDVYERASGVTTLLSTGPLGQGPQDSFLSGASEDGRRAFFETQNRLVPEDGDDCTDFYQRSFGVTQLISTGLTPTPGGLCAQVLWVGSSADGTKAFVLTDSRVTSNDTDGDVDIYEYAGGGVTLISTGPADRGADGYIDDRSIVISRDGRQIFWRTSEQLVPEDTENGRMNPDDYDLYERVDGTTRLVLPPLPGDSSPSGVFFGRSEDGSRVFVYTGGAFVAEDTDGLADFYERVGGQMRLVATGPLGSPGAGYPAAYQESLHGTREGVSADGHAVLFASNSAYVPEDTDQVQDIYLRRNGETTLVSTGPTDRNLNEPARAGEVILSPDGERVFFMTGAQLVSEDTDTHTDVYEWHAGTTTLVPHGVATPEPTFLQGTSEGGIVRDGSRVFISTASRLASTDTDDADDLYAIDLANQPPDCGSVSARPAVLWPANHKLVRVKLRGAGDPDGDAVALRIDGVTQDEPTGKGDAVRVHKPHKVLLRAERSRKGDGRVYRTAFTATDDRGATCTGIVKVSVPRHRRRAAVDSAPPSYDSFRR